MAVMKNMGKADRVLRSLLGFLLLLDGLTHFRKGTLRPLEVMTGGAFLVYGVTGFDPLLKRFGVSTIPGTADSLFNLLRQFAPGQGINPILTQQASPRHSANGAVPKSLADETAIG